MKKLILYANLWKILPVNLFSRNGFVVLINFSIEIKIFIHFFDYFNAIINSIFLNKTDNDTVMIAGHVRMGLGKGMNTRQVVWKKESDIIHY